MKINTTRFGTVEVEPDRLIRFPDGLLGFTGQERFVLFQEDPQSHFLWLQSLDRPELAFVVTDPAGFFPDYEVPLQGEQVQELGIREPSDAQILVIVNKRGHTLSVNLQGPLVVHRRDRVGRQLVLADRRYHTRVPLMQLPATTAVSA
ncbi:MAG: flagellar assembly protein FliW [Phycisphaeraceae bacterium]|nr:flagellar assembly protein FliW [Phycisphaeraceae bacterium]